MARRHGVAVILSSWFREDVEDTRMRIRSPQDLAGIWVETLRHLDQAGLLETVLFVDLCNEFPLDIWAPFLYSDPSIRRIAPGEPGRRYAARSTPEVAAWMRSAIDGVRTVHPDLHLTFSVSTELATWPEQDVGFLDVLEVHVWMANSELGDYDRRVGYHQPRLSMRTSLTRFLPGTWAARRSQRGPTATSGGVVYGCDRICSGRDRTASPITARFRRTAS